mgnify:CR=1 FL=1
MWAEQIILAVIGLSSGAVVAGGLLHFDRAGCDRGFADRTHTADHLLLYEDAAALGGIVGNLFFLFHVPVPFGRWLLPLFGLLAGMFVGCWSMALAEILNVLPIFVRRLKIVRYISAFILSMALGRGVGAVLYFFKNW